METGSDSDQLERVFLRLGHAETDEQLQNIISKFLPPVLLKLSSTQEGVRKKVMELLVHLNKRIKSRPKIQLPVETLLVQYQDPAAVSFVTNFTIIYVKMGYPRLPVEKQCELAPTLLTAMEGKPQPQQDSLMHLLIPTLFHMKYPAESSKSASPFNLAEKLLQKLNGWYMEKDEPVYKTSCALTIHAIGRYSPDVLKNHAKEVLPLAFLGMHEIADEEKSEKEECNMWTEVWQENVPGSFGGIRLYLQELITITQKALQSQSWKMKAQGAIAMASISKQTSSLVPPYLGMILSALMQGLAGRTWAGKEELLKAIACVVTACSTELEKSVPNQPTTNEILQAVLKECCKENLKYKILLETCKSITYSLENKTYSSVRTEALSVVELLLKKLEEAKQWESLTAECRGLLIESLATMETDNRPELQEKASVLKKTLESLE